ncbi:MFS transporter [Subtercola sp. YIM 133946]|uniref:MFS transporter n=1 Tax=Subtercola sp. YIM 133946 TaxID=3118909 RepID=UPI002F946671
MSLAAPRRFGALRDRPSRFYLLSAGLSMLGDNNEHVLTYWVLWQQFHSPALVGFEVVSHWLPFLLLSVPFGTLAERYDCRRLIQAAQGLFMLVSICWGVLFLTGTLQVWEACVLLVLHGCAGALWGPAEQMLLHDYAPEGELPNIVRLNATFRNLGVLCGPVVGTLLLFGLGPVWGIFANVLFYLPMTVLMLRAPYTGHTRSGAVARKTSFRDVGVVLRTVRGDRAMATAIVLTALVALCGGGSLQVAMPSIAAALGADTGVGYGLLLFANGVGGVLGGFLLEATNSLRPTVRVAVISTLVIGLTTVAVTVSGVFAIAVIALVIGGVASLASLSVAQTIVQLRAPAEQRGRTVGVFNMVGQGFRTGNGITLAVLGTAIGVVPAVAVGGAALAVGAGLIGWYARGRPSSPLGTSAPIADIAREDTA